jgi:hypothetical protein
MRNTVGRGISNRPVSERTAVEVLNEEALPTLRELRDKANAQLREAHTLSTSGDGAWTEVWRSPVLETNGLYGVVADVVGANSDYSHWCRYNRIANTAVSAALSVSISGIDAGDVWDTGSAAAVRWAADATNRQVYLEVRDDAGGLVWSWYVVADMHRLKV